MRKRLPLITIFLLNLAFISFSSTTIPQKQKTIIETTTDDEALKKKAEH